MDYLVIEGYKDAAERFSFETGLSPQVDLESIENRMVIRSAIQRGDVEDAIGRVNELDPEVSLPSSFPLFPSRDDLYTCTTPRVCSGGPVRIMFYTIILSLKLCCLIIVTMQTRDKTDQPCFSLSC